MIVWQKKVERHCATPPLAFARSCTQVQLSAVTEISCRDITPSRSRLRALICDKWLRATLHFCLESVNGHRERWARGKRLQAQESIVRDILHSRDVFLAFYLFISPFATPSLLRIQSLMISCTKPLVCLCGMFSSVLIIISFFLSFIRAAFYSLLLHPPAF